LSANSKAYDGTVLATISSNSVVLAGVLAGDAANVWLSTNGYAASFVNTNVGTNIDVIVSGLTLTGNASGDYLLDQPTNLTANITAVVLILPVVSSVGLTNQIITVVWSSAAGATYGLQYTTNISGAGWINVSTNIIATGSITSQTNDVGDAPQQFYRVFLEQQP
jgi:hypothetical protein